MKFKINNQSITLDRLEVKAAKRIASTFFQKIDNLAKQRHLPTFYFTFLIVVHVMSQELLDTIDSKNLALIMNRLNAIKDEKKE